MITRAAEISSGYRAEGKEIGEKDILDEPG
jgi:hypothetical protein